MKEPNYRRNLKERFGFGDNFTSNAIWIHAVSLGEFRASVPLIKELIGQSEKIIITTITPAGREEAQRILESDLEAGNVYIVYLPLEYDFAFNKFVKRLKPRFAIILEYELWPVMIASCGRNKIPLVLAQGQYIQSSFLFDKQWPSFRGALFKGFDLILTKSKLHSSRYKYFCDTPIETMGELRFDQKIPEEQIENAKLFLKYFRLKKPSRLCFCFGSTGPGEDAPLISLMKRLTASAKAIGIPKPFYVYVPRHKKDFLYIEKALVNSGLNFLKRSEILDKTLRLKNKIGDMIWESDGLLGNSLGEINFYFQICDYVFIGNSFNNLGSHNIIEPLALKKSVVVGPSVWGIEYPIVEALDDNIIKKVQNIEELYDYWWLQMVSKKQIHEIKVPLEAFHRTHSGATRRCIKKLEEYGFL